MVQARSIRCERGQSTVEWVGLVILVSLATAGFSAIVGVGLPGADLARAVGAKLVCAASLGDGCGPTGLLEAEYGEEVARLVRGRAPDLLYEDGMTELPVDYRECREDACSIATVASGESTETPDGLRATAFTHVVDCSSAGIDAARAGGYDCSGERAGNRYLQYWLYFPDSQTDPWGSRGRHEDDWESFQVRIGDEVAARASSHHSYNYGGGITNWPSDAGIDTKPGWGPYAAEHHCLGRQPRRARRGRALGAPLDAG